MTDRYGDIKKRLLEYAAKDGDIECIAAIGSSTRADITADEYSDLDLFIVTKNTDSWLSGGYPARLGSVSIAFTEPTLGGGMEYRAIYDDDRDVDMIILTPAQFEACIKDGTAQWVMNRGVELLADKSGFGSLIEQYVTRKTDPPHMSEAEFINTVNDFYFHNIWACKKLRRGELWSAKMCVDSYLKKHLLKIIELYCYNKNGTDVWHDGRFLDSWAEGFILDELKGCFAHYDKADIKAALDATHRLFARLGRECAQMLGFTYPESAEKCAGRYLENAEN